MCSFNGVNHLFKTNTQASVGNGKEMFITKSLYGKSLSNPIILLEEVCSNYDKQCPLCTSQVHEHKRVKNSICKT